MDTSNKNKTIEQMKALNSLAANKFIGSIIAGTGFGKSRCVVLAIEHALKYEDNSLVLVPTIQLQDQFRKEFDKWNVDSSNVEILCYQSAYKLVGNHYSIVV